MLARRAATHKLHRHRLGRRLRPRTCDRLRCQVSGAKEMMSLLSATEPRCFTISAIFSGG